MIKETAYKTLDNIAKIADREQRKVALRNELTNNNALAIIVQRTYHPRYTFELPVGPISADIVKKSGHDEAGPMYNNLRRWDILRPISEQPTNAGITQSKREEQFLSLYEAVSNDDADLLVGVKDKELPWPTLDAEFVVEALPEMFPPSFRPEGTRTFTKPVVQQTTQTIADIIDSQKNILENHADGYGSETEPKKELDGHTLVEYDNEPPAPAVANKSKKQQCLEIMQNNPGLARKDYLVLFEAIGVNKTTASLYYQQLKGTV